MLATTKKVPLTLLLAAAVTTVARAQQKPKECEVDEGKPGEVARAVFSLQVAQTAKPEDAAKQLKSAIGFAKPGMPSDGEILVAGDTWPPGRVNR